MRKPIVGEQVLIYNRLSVDFRQKMMFVLRLRPYTAFDTGLIRVLYGYMHLCYLIAEETRIELERMLGEYE